MRTHELSVYVLGVKTRKGISAKSGTKNLFFLTNAREKVMYT
jgi:hypothetical protein